MSAVIHKAIRIGHAYDGEVWIEVYYGPDRANNPEQNMLAITGVIGPRRNGDARGDCGQIDLDDVSGLILAPQFERLPDIWKRWHLNTARPGTPAQMEFLRSAKLRGGGYYYERACDALRAVGLYEDNGYRYGTSWLYEEVPADVVAYLDGLPDNTPDYPWTLVSR